VIECADDTGDDVVDIGKVAPVPAVITSTAG
jgi:hypothetical protein